MLGAGEFAILRWTIALKELVPEVELRSKQKMMIPLSMRSVQRMEVDYSSVLNDEQRSN